MILILYESDILLPIIIMYVQHFKEKGGCVEDKPLDPYFFHIQADVWVENNFYCVTLACHSC